IIEWRETAPWQELRYVEQDLLISRALVSIYRNKFLRSKLAFRGGTAMYKLFITEPVRYSEDIDFVQIDAEPIGEILDNIRAALSFIGEPKVVRKADSVKLLYRFNAEEPQGVVLRLKVEINSREHFSVYKLEPQLFTVNNQWYSGNCEITTYRFDELIGTKIRALYQRRKGRDLLDIYIALKSGMIDPSVAVECFRKYIGYNGHRIPNASEFADNLHEKMQYSDFRDEILPYLAININYDAYEAYNMVLENIVAIM
ncbi:MAG: nucleotidyl transferase AbiEii/AbiGii toxin family protein, partial [Oscillospiraceae bacterium]|nr:nucleotidyl transferase AbiEii/AbiGii toxin family protein [Oscillospiraceae bacterium]